MTLAARAARAAVSRESALIRTISTNKCIDRGQTLPYLRARLRRDRPDIADRLDAGEFTSVRAAALEAGIVDPTFSCPTDPVKAAIRIRRHFAGDRLAALIEELQK